MPGRCPDCGSELPERGPVGRLCPRCLLGLGLAGSGAVVTAAATTGAGDREGSAARLPAEKRVPATMTVGAPVQISSETESLLRGRLQVGAWIIVLGLSGFVVRDLLLSSEPLGSAAGIWQLFGARALLLLFYAGVIGLLRGRRHLSLPRLRVLEAAILWAVALWFVADRVHFMRRAIAARDAAGTLWAMALAVMIYFAFLSAYAFFAPNAWKRALWMTALIASLPIAIVAIVVVTDPAATPFLFESIGPSRFVGMALTLGIGVMIAAWGAHRIHTLRVEVFEAKRLGQYRLTERIGSGGMGEVWRADHQLLARPAAIKLIKPGVIDSDPALAHDFVRSFEREAQITASLRSTHSVELYDFGVTADSTFYYVMELLDGKDLEAIVRQTGPLDPARVAYLLEQVCDSLADAHARGLVHRDIKPANIQVCRMGRRFDFVKVLDFGLVKRRAPAGESRAVGDAKRVVVGTPSYIAPEMVTADEIDARADIYALGCVGYWLLTGHTLFDGRTTAEIVAKHVHDEVVPPGERVGRAIPPELEAIILRCVEKTPGVRPQSADELARLLRDTGLVAAWTQDHARAWWEQNELGGENDLSAARSEP